MCSNDQWSFRSWRQRDERLSAHRGPKDRPRCASRGVVPGPRGGGVDVLQVAQPAPTPAKRRRADLDVEVRACFDASGGTYGSPRVRAALRRSGREVSKKTVESSMARQGLQGRSRRRRRGLTRPDKRAEPVPDLLRRDFTADGVNEKWVGDFKQINTGEGPVFLATVEDLFSRRMLGFAQSDRHPTAQLATDALNMAAAVRGGAVAGVIFHTDKGSRSPPGHGPDNQSMARPRAQQLIKTNCPASSKKYSSEGHGCILSQYQEW